MVRANWKNLRPLVRYSGGALVALAVIVGANVFHPASAATTKQTTFTSPEQAVDSLLTAVRAGNKGDLLRILGPEGKKLISSGDPVADGQARDKFVAKADEGKKVVKEGDARAILVVGKDEWPLPIPIVKQDSGWHFDTKAGAQEIVDRRIGANELNAIEVCRAYVDAQTDYAMKDRNNDGFKEYAQKFVSSPGKHDGLYWPAQAGEEESPMGPLAASARAEGYGSTHVEGKRTPYYGYYYRILKAQGKSAPGGAVDYVVKGHMIGGFALVAFPAEYGVSGIMSFIVSYDGVVYQKDLGPSTAKIAGAMTRFDPDPTWKTP